MKKFWSLYRKEVRELLTPLMIIPLLLTMVLFYGVGKLATNEAKKSSQPQKIMVVDEDKTVTSGIIADTLSKAKYILIPPTATPLTDTERAGGIAYIVIPTGFGAGISAGHSQTVDVHGILGGLSVIGLQKQNSVSAIISSISQSISDRIVATQSNLSPAFVRQPININNFAAVGNLQANVSLAEIVGFVQSQTYFIPLIVMIVIVFAAQMIATSIASEKENKTLETLLSTPVNRRSIVWAKLLSAGTLALLFSVVYLVAFRSYINGFTGGATSTVTPAVSAALTTLGLKFSVQAYALLGVSLFLGITGGLAIALILGSFAEDVKSIQGVITPLMVLVMIPYFIITFTDFSSLSPIVRYIVYAIPFSHPFLAVQFLTLHNYLPIVWGIIYQLVFVIVCVYIASRIFQTDAIVTLRLNFGKKR